MDAIFEFRRSEIGRRRDELLDGLEREGQAIDMRALARALIEPLAAELSGEEESHYLPFLAHLFLQSPHEVADILRRHQAAETRWSQLVGAAVPQVPRELLRTRLYLMGRHVVVSLAAYQRRGRLGSEGPDFEIYLSDMLDSVAGYMAAAPAAGTLSLLEARTAKAVPAKSA